MPNLKLETYKNKATGTVYDYTDAAAQASIAAIEEKIPDVASSENQLVTEAGLNNVLNFKEDKVPGKGLSTNDYDNTAKGIVDNIQSNIIANTKLIKDTVGWSGKNKIPYPYYHTTRTENGITFTDNGDGTVTANGTATAMTWFSMIATSYANASNLFEKGQRYILNGCPKGGNGNYRIRFNCNPYSYVNDDLGDGVEFEYPDDSTLTHVYIMIGVSSGATLNNVKFKPMLRDADILDDTYEPYFGSTAFPRSEQAVLGAKNILPNNNTTQTINGIPFTKNADGSVTIGAGTASANTSYILGDINPKAGNYILSRGTTNGQAFLSVSKYNGSTWVAGLAEIGNQAISEKEFTIDYVGYDTVRGFLYIGSGVTISTPYTVYPMIRVASDKDDTYAPYAMTNRELTDAVTKETIQYASKSDAIATLNKAYIKKVGSVCQCVIDFVVGSANINAWTNLVTFSENTGISPGSNQIIAIRDVTDTTKSSIVGAVINSGNLQIGSALTAEHRYMASFSYIAES